MALFVGFLYFFEGFESGDAIVNSVFSVDPIIEQLGLNACQTKFLVIYHHDSLGAAFLNL